MVETQTAWIFSAAAKKYAITSATLSAVFYEKNRASGAIQLFNSSSWTFICLMRFLAGHLSPIGGGGGMVEFRFRVLAYIQLRLGAAIGSLVAAKSFSSRT